MAGRLTRSHRRELENKTQQTIDLDKLAKFEAEQLVSNVKDVPPMKEIKEQASEAEKEKAASSDEEESSQDESSDEDSSDSSEDEDEDLDALLEKAQEALASQTASIRLENDTSDKINTKLSKMDAGITVEKELYLKNVAGRAKLIPDAVALVDDGEKASAKATVVLKPSKDEKHLSKKERQAVSSPLFFIHSATCSLLYPGKRKDNRLSMVWHAQDRDDRRGQTRFASAENASYSGPQETL